MGNSQVNSKLLIVLVMSLYNIYLNLLIYSIEHKEFYLSKQKKMHFDLEFKSIFINLI